ncbi:MAG TPA: hypothetical protein VEG34_17955, partial [Thermoanaerobaculia bacterium]|nr:hypothetical protein [Thermoanaerobaculia bacterium]
MFRSSNLVRISVLVGVLTVGLAAGSAPAAAQEERQVLRPGGFNLPWDPDRPVPPYIPEDFRRNGERLGLVADADHTVSVRIGTSTMTLALASGAAAPGAQSLGLLQVDSPDNPGLAGAYQVRLVTAPPARNARMARFALPASALQLVRED